MSTDKIRKRIKDIFDISKDIFLISFFLFLKYHFAFLIYIFRDCAGDIHLKLPFGNSIFNRDKNSSVLAAFIEANVTVNPFG